MQKTRCWTAGSIFKKLRGLLAKFWAKLQIVLHYYGLRVDNYKLQGLLCKTAAANRYAWMWAAGSGSNGLDLRGKLI